MKKLAAIVAATVLASVAQAQTKPAPAAKPAQANAAATDSAKFVKRGTLTCDVSASIGLVLGSSKGLTCSFSIDGKKAPQAYTGTLKNVGLDIGITAESKLAWDVLAAPKADLKGKLAGIYSGPSAEISAGLGLGAKSLVAESKEVALQPLETGAKAGLNLALGIASMELTAAK
jgi:hypothetical protein